MPIAARTLRIHAGTYEQDVPIVLLAPQESRKGGWFCSYSIGWPGEPRHAEGWGFDGFQALHLTLERIGLDLYTSPYHEAGELVWLQRGDGYGFPVPPNIRHMLIGGDRLLSGGWTPPP